MTKKEIKAYQIKLNERSKNCIYQKHSTHCIDKNGTVGSFYYIGIFPENYEQISPTFTGEDELINLFQWRNKKIMED